MDNSWQNNLDEFLNTVAKQLQAGDTVDVLRQRFGGKTIRWSGILDEKTLEEPAPSVDINVPHKVMDVGNGRLAEFAGLSVPVAANTVAAWDAIQIGSRVAFTATLLSPALSPFLPVEVHELRSGRTLVSIGLTGGVPLL